MIFLLFILAFLVVADHFIKYQPQGLVFYKNEHHFSIIVAVRRYTENLETLIEKSKHSKHQFIFVSINNAMGDMNDKDLTIVEVDCELDKAAYIKATPFLSTAYNQGYKHATNEFLLFMDSTFVFDNFKTIDHMANNLVEHQVYTIKETLPFRDQKQGYRLFIDIFRDMNLEADMVNYAFYAVKRSTYELTGCHDMVFHQAEDFEDTIAKRNVSIVHIKQDNTIYRHEPLMSHHAFIGFWFERMKVKSRLVGFRRLLLFLIAFHAFYGYVIADSILNGFSVWNVVFVITLPLATFVAIRPYVSHHGLNYVLLPFYMLYFDGLLLIGWAKRLLHKYKTKKAQSKDAGSKTVEAQENVSDLSVAEEEQTTQDPPNIKKEKTDPKSVNETPKSAKESPKEAPVENQETHAENTDPIKEKKPT